MTKDELLKQMTDQRAQFFALLNDVPVEEWIVPGAYGDWSVKDVLVHVSRWESEIIKVLFQAEQGTKPQSEVFNPEYLKVNDLWYKESKDRPLEQVIDDFNSVRIQLARRLTDFPEKALIDPARYPWLKNHALIGLVKDIVLDHEAEHLEGLMAWRANRAQSGA